MLHDYQLKLKAAYEVSKAISAESSRTLTPKLC